MFRTKKKTASSTTSAGGLLVPLLIPSDTGCASVNVAVIAAACENDDDDEDADGKEARKEEEAGGGDAPTTKRAMAAVADLEDSHHRRHNSLLHPNSVFEQRRYSFSNVSGDKGVAARLQQQPQPRRASYDRCRPAHHGCGEPTTAERRASYDVSFLKRTSPHLQDDPKSSRRDSLVRRWFDRLSNAADAHKSKDHKHKTERSSDVSNVSTHDLENCENVSVSESNTKAKDNDVCNANENSSIPNDARHSYDESSPQGNETTAKKPSSGGIEGTSPGLRKKRITSAEPPRLTTEVPLIEPSQVLISQRSVLTAEPVLTPLERLRRKDEVIKEALLEKQKLIADILHVPKEEFDSSEDSVTEHVHDKEASELVLAAVNRVDHLTSILNEFLRVTEEDVVAASCEVNTTNRPASSVSSSSSNNNNSSSGSGGIGGGGGSGNSTRIFPAIPVPRLQSIVHSLSAHLTQLLTLTTERDEEREKLRQELQRSREKLHAVYEMQQLVQCLNDESAHVPSTSPSPSPNQADENLTNDNQEDENKNLDANLTPDINNYT